MSLTRFAALNGVTDFDDFPDPVISSCVGSCGSDSDLGPAPSAMFSEDSDVLQIVSDVELNVTIDKVDVPVRAQMI